MHAFMHACVHNVGVYLDVCECLDVYVYVYVYQFSLLPYTPDPISRAPFND